MHHVPPSGDRPLPTAGPGRRSGSRAAAAALLSTVVALSGCGDGGGSGEPTIPEVDFTPVAVIEIDGDRTRAADGPSARDAASLDPLTVAGGSVIEVRNTGDEPARLRGGSAFDTGVIAPGEKTVVVVTNDSGDDRRHPLDDGVDVTSNDAEVGPLGVVIVTPRPQGT